MKKFLLFVGILVLIGLGALIAYRVKEKLTQKEEMKAKNVAPVTVALADVVKGELADIGNFTGTLEADSLFNISPKTAGRLKTLNFNIGDAVKLNDAVAELDDDEQQQSVNEESAALVVCEAQVKSSQAGVMSAKTQILSAESGVKNMLVGPINEWGEGSYIEPNAEFGFGMYEAIRNTFGIKPAEGWPVNFTPKDVGLGPYPALPIPKVEDSNAKIWYNLRHENG